jgi:magnesium chelatase family protein
MFATSKSSCIVGLEAVPVQVEVSMKEGERRFSILGLGGAAVRESRERIISALEMSGIDVPPVILVNLAPAEVRKDSTCFDLPIALALACAVGAIPQEALFKVSACGELSLAGEVKHTAGITAHAIAAVKQGISMIFVPAEDAAEAAVVEGITVIGVESLGQAIRIFKGGEVPEPHNVPKRIVKDNLKSLDDVLGQHAAKRALTISAAGGHNLLMIGPPGCGKSMLAERMPSLLPPLNTEEMLEVLRIHSVANQGTDDILAGIRPVRTPHYVVSDAGLIGGGAGPRPGEVSLAHHGVLFLDEFPEFRRSAVEALRSPMECGWVQIARARASVSFPARFQLIAAMNPCPCGRFGSGVGVCRCSHFSVRDYLAKLSQPILDRIDLHVELEAVNVEDLVWARPKGPRGEPKSGENLERAVLAARERQISRQGVLNSQLPDGLLREGLLISDGARSLLTEAVRRIGISARGFSRVLRVAKTIADLSGVELINEEIVAEAVSYRSLDKLSSIIHGVLGRARAA